MVPTMEVPFSSRGALRRGVTLGCEVTTQVFGPRRETIVDLSPRGARIATDLPVERGEYVLVHFAPHRLDRRVETMARVAHVARITGERPSIGVEFVGLAGELRAALAHSLHGVPPPLPPSRARTRPDKTLIWVDVFVTWEEDLGDRVNIWEIRERFAAQDDGEMLVESSRGS
jgi:hypothetical protein